MTAKNDITGDAIASKTTSDEFRKNWDLIFKKPQREDKELTPDSKQEDVSE